MDNGGGARLDVQTSNKVSGSVTTAKMEQRQLTKFVPNYIFLNEVSWISPKKG